MKIIITLVLIFLTIFCKAQNISHLSDTLDIYIFKSKYSADSANNIINIGEGYPKTLTSTTITYTQVFYDKVNKFWYILDDYDIVEKYLGNPINKLIYY